MLGCSLERRRLDLEYVFYKLLRCSESPHLLRQHQAKNQVDQHWNNVLNHQGCLSEGIQQNIKRVAGLPAHWLGFGLSAAKESTVRTTMALGLSAKPGDHLNDYLQRNSIEA